MFPAALGRLGSVDVAEAIVVPSWCVSVTPVLPHACHEKMGSWDIKL